MQGCGLPFIDVFGLKYHDITHVNIYSVPLQCLATLLVERHCGSENRVMIDIKSFVFFLLPSHEVQKSCSDHSKFQETKDEIRKIIYKFIMKRSKGR